MKNDGRCIAPNICFSNDTERSATPRCTNKATESLSGMPMCWVHARCYENPESVRARREAMGMVTP